MSKIVAHNPFEGSRPDLVIDLHDGSEELVSIIVVHKDQKEYLNLCLQSITLASFAHNYELIVVDNGSGKDSQEFLDEIEEDGVKVVRRDVSEKDCYNPDGRFDPGLYWGPAANKGAEAADKGAKYFIFMHCDVVVLEPGWIDTLINAAEANGSGMVGSELSKWFIQGQEVSFVSEWCMLMTRECWTEIGPFPKELPQLGTTLIMTMRAQKAGYEPRAVMQKLCHHYRIFGLNYSDFELLTQRAKAVLPKLMQQLQAFPV